MTNRTRVGRGRFLGCHLTGAGPPGFLSKSGPWNPHDPRLLTPKSFGWGYDINFYELLARMGIMRRR